MLALAALLAMGVRESVRVNAAMVNIGTLAAFFLVCLGVVSLRYTHPDLPRPFRTPWSPAIPLLAAAACLYPMLNLPALTWGASGCGWRSGLRSTSPTRA